MDGRQYRSNPLDPPTVPIPVVGRGRGRSRTVVFVAVLVLAAATGVGGVFGVDALLRVRAQASAPITAAAPATPSAPAASAPATTPVDTDPGPVLVDSDGRPVPGTATGGIRDVYVALRDGDLTTLRRLYRPTSEGPGWAEIAPSLARSELRDDLLATLRTRPGRGEDVEVIYSSGDLGVGFSVRGVLTYLNVGPNATSAAAEPPAQEDDDPYGCLAADRRMDAGEISYAEHPCASHFQDTSDPTLIQPDTPATRWALCHQQPSADDPDYIVGARKRYC